jgi:4-amino-4-deoxy-L-arabinose transferase-like glycosyltransferase
MLIRKPRPSAVVIAASAPRRISYDGTATPTKTALFLLICCAWILPGLIGHDPWKPYEATAMGVVHANSLGANWLVPSIAGVPFFEHAPLFYWLASVCAAVFSWLLPLHDAARLATGVCVALSVAGVYFAALELNGPRAGRIAVVLLLGTIGLLVRGHLLNPEIIGLTGITCSLYGLAVIRRRPSRGIVWLTMGVVVSGLGVGWHAALGVALTCAAIPFASVHWREPSVLRRMAVAVILGAAVISLWPIYLVSQGFKLNQWILAASGSPALTALFAEGAARFNLWFYFRTGVWYLLPAWPIALFASIKHRRSALTAPETALPLVFSVVLSLVIVLIGKPQDATFLLMIAPITLLAVPAIDHVPRSITSFLEWFGLATFSVSVVLIWATWSSYMTGLPRNFARWVARNAPGYVHEGSWVLPVFALGLTVLWILVVRKANRSNRRAVVNWTAGLTAVWLLINALGLSAVNYAASHRTTFTNMQSELQAYIKSHPEMAAGAQCVTAINLGDSQRALLYYFTRLQTIPKSSSQSAQCAFTLLQTQTASEHDFPITMKELWRGGRPADKEQFRLFVGR